ncbi:hypothetical protein MMC28_008347 [Mycoblastus sanguinarius]|nr:hypothetical protein [Mycoblastus sanguinarius]
MDIISLPRVAFTICALLAYYFSLAVYRLFFSPLAKFPGPKIAALTLWYEYYYDVVKRGRYSWKIKEMHEKYGPIVRINPYEIHINDPDYYDEIYVSSSRRTEKYPWAAKMFGHSTSTLAAVSHEVHRTRKAAIAPFLSKASVQRLEPAVQSVITKMVQRLQEFQSSGRVVNVIDVYAALTTDVITQYAFAESFNFMDHPDFAPFWRPMWMDINENSHVKKQFGWFEPMMRSLPKWLAKIMNPQMASFMKYQDERRAQVVQVKANLEAGIKPTGQRTIFYDILTNPQVGPEEKTTRHLMNEAQVLVAAGTVSTGHTLSTTTFHVLDNPEILCKLQDELKTVMPNADASPSWTQLERLPYLTAVIKEGLRIGYGFPHRMQRVSPDVALQFHDWTIPVGTPVSMSSLMIHDNPSIFPNPRTFDPERWLQPSTKRLEKYLVPFSRGSRQCAGMALAYSELYLGLAALFCPDRFRLELYETDKSDVEVAHDFFNACYRLDSKGVRILLN